MQVPKRSKRFGVGKEIGGAVFVHRSAESVLPADALSAAKAKLHSDYALRSFTVTQRRPSAGCRSRSSSGMSIFFL